MGCFIQLKIFFLQIKTQQALPGTIAATFKLTEPNWIGNEQKSIEKQKNGNIFFNLSSVPIFPDFCFNKLKRLAPETFLF